MKRTSILPALALLLAAGGCTRTLEYDICVYGGTSSGVIAAYSAAMQGKTVVVVEPGHRAGGLSSGGLGQTDIGNKQAVEGLSLDFYRRVGQHYGELEKWIFEPKVALGIFNDYIERGGVDMLYGHRILRADKQGTRIESVRLQDTGKPLGRTVVRAKQYIDCSYEGDLMARAGVSYVVGREDNATYGETWNGVQMRPTHQFPDGVDPYRIEGDSTSGLLWGISDGTLAAKGSGDDKVQAYNFRICLTDEPENSLPIERPADYDPTRYELLLRLIEASGNHNLYSYIIMSHMPNRKTDINNNGGFSTDMIGMNHNYPEASYRQREKIFDEHLSYTLGLLYFLGHDERVPEKMRTEMLRWGLPKDEYTDNGHWTPQLYIRESRRMVGEYVATQADCENRTTVEDGVGMAAYTMDSHNCQRIVIHKDGRAMVKNEGDVQIGIGSPYPVSYRSITPKREECTNLLVPVCLSASHIAYGSIRMEPVFMVLGQSAAKAACLAIDNNTDVQKIDVAQIQRMYDEDPLLDGTAPDILVDDTAVEPAGNSQWRRVNTYGGYGPSLYMLEPTVRTEALRYPFSVKRDGRYTIYTYYSKRGGMSKLSQLTVFDGAEHKRITIDYDAVTIHGQTSGEWVSLGEYDLRAGTSGYVEFDNGGEVTGTLYADAVLVVPKRQ